MTPRKHHEIKLSGCKFIENFLRFEWQVIEEERNNFDTEYNASYEVIWLSFQHFMSINGYVSKFCNKILLGKFLRHSGVNKIKRGPRGKQKFYYFPLKPVEGSFSEAIMATYPEARHCPQTGLMQL